VYSGCQFLTYSIIFCHELEYQANSIDKLLVGLGKQVLCQSILLIVMDYPWIIHDIVRHFLKKEPQSIIKTNEFHHGHETYRITIIRCYNSNGITLNVHVCCLHLKMEFRSCARVRPWCGIIHYHWWTASIKPKLLFSRADYASWGLSLLSVWLGLNDVVNT